MKLFGQAAQEPRVLRRVDCHVTSGIGGQCLPDLGIPALRGAGAAPPAAVHLVDNAAGRCRRIGTAVIVPYGKGVRTAFRVDGVAGAVGDDQHHLRVAGVQIVIAPADGPPLRNPRYRVATCSGLQARRAAACDTLILRRNPAAAIRLFQEVPPVPILEAVVAGSHDGKHPGTYG